MASAQQIKALLRSHIEGDEEQFFSIAMQVAAYEAKQGHGKLAEDLRVMIDDAKALRSHRLLQKPTPIAQPKGDLAGLLDVSYPKARLTDMVLSRELNERLARIVKEHRHFSKINAYGLSPRRRLLLLGPPGTGKTLTASALAGELGLPLFRIRLDALITKFLGETAAKLRLVFNAATNTRGVYFFDEFDAIASRREMSNDVGEMRRTLNSFLQMIEQDESNGLIIAATNHPEILDHAVFRRFDDVIHYTLPSRDQIVTTLKNRLSKFADAQITWKRIGDTALSMSYADLTRAADEAIKDAIIHDRNIVGEHDLLKSFEDRKLLHTKK